MVVENKTRRTRRTFAAFIALFAGSVVEVLIWAGDSSNSLHASAMSWAWWTITLVFLGYVLDVNVEKWLDNKRIF